MSLSNEALLSPMMSFELLRADAAVDELENNLTRWEIELGMTLTQMFHTPLPPHEPMKRGVLQIDRSVLKHHMMMYLIHKEFLNEAKGVLVKMKELTNQSINGWETSLAKCVNKVILEQWKPKEVPCASEMWLCLPFVHCDTLSQWGGPFTVSGDSNGKVTFCYDAQGLHLKSALSMVVMA